MSRKLADKLIVAAILLAVALLYRKAARLWWVSDDLYQVHLAAEHRVLDCFFDRSLWQSTPSQLFTPFVTASFRTELDLFGPDPRPFYAVQLALLAIIAIALAFTLRLWMSRAGAACAAFLFLAGTPTAVMASELMLVHYLESVILSIGSAALFAIGMRSQRRLHRIGSGLLYLMAILAKEIALPLPAVLLFLPERDVRARLRAMWPHAVAILVYFVWRYAMLGKWLGGYAWTFGVSGVPALALRTVWNIVRTFAGPRFGIGLPLLMVIGAGVLLRLRSRVNLAGVAIAFAVAIGPILPVAVHYEHRFAWPAWICAAIIFAAGADTLRDRRIMLAVMIAAPMVALFANRQQWNSEFRTAKRMSDEGRVFTDLGGGDLLRMPAIPAGEMFQLAWVKEFMLHRSAGTLWFYDDLYLCAGAKPRRVFGFDERSRQVRDLTAEMPAIVSRYCASIRPNEPLQLHFHFDDRHRLLTWDLGPYQDGYTVVTGNGFLAYDVKRRDGLQLFAEKGLTFRLRYQSPQGWVTYSPELSLDLTKDQDVVWQRSSALSS